MGVGTGLEHHGPRDLHYYVGQRSEMLEDARHGNHTRTPEARPRLGFAVLLALAGLVGCAKNESTVTLEVYSWWQEQTEASAFNEVEEIHEREHPNVVVKNLGDTNSTDTRDLMAARMLSGAAPATFQANIGADLLRWTVVDTKEQDAGLDGGLKSYRLIAGLSDFYRREGLREKLWDGLYDNLTVQGVPYGVPINVHRNNVVYYRREGARAFEQRTQKKLLDIGTLCPEGEYDPDDPDLELDIRIVVGAGKQAWTLGLLTFEAVLPAIVRRRTGSAAATETFYNDLFLGRRPEPRDANGVSDYVREAFECVQYLSRWFSRITDSLGNRVYDPDVGWAEAVKALRDDPNPTFTVMGDWANGLLPNALKAEEDDPSAIAGEPFPGSGDLFVYTSDTFPLPRSAKHLAEVETLLETIATPKAQEAFSSLKGSIPALRRADTTRLAVWQQTAAAAFDSPSTRRLLATSGRFPPFYPQTELYDALVTMTGWDAVRDNPTEEERRTRRARLEAALRFFTDAETILERWQARLAGEVPDATIR
jgi:glucose/mannose transport system substrate-binding protein